MGNNKPAYLTTDPDKAKLVWDKATEKISEMETDIIVVWKEVGMAQAKLEVLVTTSSTLSKKTTNIRQKAL